MTKLRQLWSRYMTWRSTPGTPPPKLPKRLKKIDVSDEDIASHTTSNPSTGYGSV